MPKKMEKALKKQAKKKFPGDKERQDRYVFGTLRKTGWVPSTQKKGKRNVKKARKTQKGKVPKR